MRPRGSRPKISAAIRRAEIPFSGSRPAWAARPVIVAVTTFCDGAWRMILLGGPSPSNTIPTLPAIMLKSRLWAPTKPPSSWRVKTISMARLPLFCSSADCKPSSIIATPALQSPPRMVLPSDRTIPSSTTGLMPRPGSTVSRWAERMNGLPTPSRLAITFL